MKKTISVPINSDAKYRLDMGQERDGDLVEKDLTLDDFDILFTSGWVKEINDTLGVNIDDYEDEHISDEHKIIKFIDISNNYFKRFNIYLFKSIAELAGIGLEKKTGISFYF